MRSTILQSIIDSADLRVAGRAVQLPDGARLPRLHGSPGLAAHDADHRQGHPQVGGPATKPLSTVAFAQVPRSLLACVPARGRSRPTAATVRARPLVG